MDKKFVNSCLCRDLSACEVHNDIIFLSPVVCISLHQSPGIRVKGKTEKKRKHVLVNDLSLNQCISIMENVTTE